MSAVHPGRPREFDLDEGLDTAVHLFWERGYAATSVADLIDAMGISRSSLYQAFGSKDELFVAALERYGTREFDRLTAVLRASEDGLAAIEAFFHGLVRHLASPRGRYGCLVTNTTTELAVVEPRIRLRVTGMVGSLESAFRECLGVARANGEIVPNADLQALARHLTAVTQGLQVLAKTQPGESYLRDVAAVALTSIPNRL
jgi:TetR/AcrR family transcriptional repressor of nem operon